VAPVNHLKQYLPKLLLILMDVQGIYVDKIDPNFYEKKYPEVPHWVRQRRILRILLVLVTGLVTHI
jgi:hypothetical protein